MLKGPSGTNWEFEGFKVLTEMRLLLSDGTPVPLTSKAFDTLVILIENSDRVVTKDELLRSVWPDVEVEEGNLTQQIFLLRKALGENAQQPRYIVTVPGHGYRFTARVKAISDDPATTGVAMGGAAIAVGLPGSVVRGSSGRAWSCSAPSPFWRSCSARAGWRRTRQARPWSGRRPHHKGHGKRQGHEWRHLPRRPVRRLRRERWRSSTASG